MVLLIPVLLCRNARTLAGDTALQGGLILDPGTPRHNPQGLVAIKRVQHVQEVSKMFSISPITVNILLTFVWASLVDTPLERSR